MPRVIRKDLIAEISNKTGVKHQDVSRIVDAFLEGLVDHLGQGKVVALRDFGTFDLRVSRRKIGRNPKRPDVPIVIPDRHVIRFRPGGKLETLVASVPVQTGGLNHNHSGNHDHADA